MTISKLVAAALLAGSASAVSTPSALAQAQAPTDKPTVGKYLADGYEVQRAEIGNPFLQFILQKKTASGLVLRAGADRRNLKLPHHQVRFKIAA